MCLFLPKLPAVCAKPQIVGFVVFPAFRTVLADEQFAQHALDLKNKKQCYKRWEKFCVQTNRSFTVQIESVKWSLQPSYASQHTVDWDIIWISSMLHLYYLRLSCWLFWGYITVYFTKWFCNCLP